MFYKERKGVLFIKLLSQIINGIYIGSIVFNTSGILMEERFLNTANTAILQDIKYKNLMAYSIGGRVKEEGITVIDTKNVVKEKSTIQVIKVEEEIAEIIYNPENLREVSNLSKDQIFDILEGSNLQVLSEHYYNMEEQYSINALFLIALNTEESGHGRSSLAINKNNIGGVRAVGGGWATFDSWEDSLEHITALLDREYLSETGVYYNGMSIYNVNVRYCQGTQWAKNLNTIAYEFMDKVQEEESSKFAEAYNY